MRLVLLLGVLAILGCGGPPDNNNTNFFAVPVTVAEVEVSDMAWTRSYNGSLAGIRQAEPTAKIPETIIAIPIAEGESVRAGDVLIEFDKYGPSSQVRQAEAAYLDAQRNFEKYQRLFEGGAVSQRDRDFHETQFTISKANYEAARDQVLVKSPINGILTAIHVKIGQQAHPGQVLAVVAAVDTMRLTFDVPYFDARPMKKRAPVQIRSELDTTITATGWIQEISESADPVTRTVSVEVLMTNPDRYLRPGMYVTGEILLDRLEQVLTIPIDALVDRGDTRGVFVAADSLVRFVPITEGLAVGERVQVKSGLTRGDQVVILGKQSLQDSTRISIEAVE
ncbi:efflux RND transporter periplasmic adaptor subunit [Candidatus Zixiibacteriota bacterium]